MNKYNYQKYKIAYDNQLILNKNYNLRNVDLGQDNFINCFNKNGNNRLIIDNKKVFLNKINSTNLFGINVGEYKLTNNNDDYPVGFVCSSDIIKVTNGNYVDSKFIEGFNINFYTGNIEFTVLKKFHRFSLYFLNNGYLNGRNVMYFTNLCGNVSCGCYNFQDYTKPFSAILKKDCALSQIWQNVLCQNAKNAQIRRVIKQQDLYTTMRRHPQLFPIISTVKMMNLSLANQRKYSNMWYRQFGTSQALPVNDNWGGFFLPGSETPFTN